MDENKKQPPITTAESTRALLCFAIAVANEIKHLQGYDKDRFVKSIDTMVKGLQPKSEGVERLIDGLKLALDGELVLDNEDDDEQQQ